MNSGSVACHLRDRRSELSKPPAPRTSILPFSFVYDSRPSDTLLVQWPVRYKKKALNHHRAGHTLIWVQPGTSLEVWCEAIEHAEFPVAELTLHFKNNGPRNTPVLENIRALDTRLERGVAGACRRAGLDFMAPTDHRNYASSMTATEAFEGLPAGFRIYPGEEVHAPDNPVHIISFGANAGFTELYRDDASACRKDVEALVKSLPQTPVGVNRFQYAACKWVVDRIQERNGMAMFCHPYLVTGSRHNIDEALLDHIFGKQLFDAFELISGDSVESIPATDINALQVARYAEERAKGRRAAVCAISDTHGVERSDAFGRYFNVCFRRRWS